MSWFNLGWLEQLTKFAKMIPVLSEAVKIAQMAQSFITSVMNGDIAGAFKSLLQPLLDLAVTAVLDQIGVGDLISSIGDKLAGQLANQLPEVLGQIQSMGESMGMSSDEISSLMKGVTDSFSKLETFYQSPAFTQMLSNDLGHMGADVALNADDLSKLKGGLLNSVVMDALGASGVGALMPNLGSINLSGSSFKQETVSGGYADPVNLVTPPPPGGTALGSEINLGDVQNA